MKIIATSDWHLGNIFHGNDRLEEHRHFLRWLIVQIREQQPDALLVAGDVFDNGNPSAAAQTAYYEFLADATKECPQMQVIITAGNHDSANRLEAPRPLLTRHHVEIRGNVKRCWELDEDGNGLWIINDDDLMIPVKGQDGSEIIVLAVPYLRTDVVQGDTYSKGVRDFLMRMTRKARKTYPGKKLVMMAHMYATGADIARIDASERIIIGGMEQVDMEGWTDHPDYLTCGHIHKRQHIWHTDWARYTGSVLPMSFAEKDYTHGVDLITFNNSHRTVKQLVYEPQHQLLELPEEDEDLTLKKLERLIKEKLTDRTNGKLDEHFDYVRLKVKFEKVNADDIKMLEELVNSKNAVHCGIQKIMPQLGLATITGNEKIESIEDILNREPLEVLKEAFLLKYNDDMNEHQETLLTNLIKSIKYESDE